MSTGTLTQTYTVADLRRVLDCFAADFYMMGASTRLRSRDNVAKVVHDLKAFAQAGYLLAVTVILRDSLGKELRAAEYRVSTSAIGWESQRPGDNLWPATAGGSLGVIATLSTEWWNMSDVAKIQFRKVWELNSPWDPTTIDTSHSGLVSEAGRRYASNGYGMARVNFR